MYLFSYERITDSFVQKVADKVLAAESTVLIGPRYGGKRHVLYLLRKFLEDQGLKPIVDIEFLDKPSLLTQKDVHALIQGAVSCAGFEGTSRFNDLMTQPIERLAARKRSPVLLLASNIDGMAHHLARAFLEELRTQVEKGHVIAVLSGESDFHELVYGPKSEFNVASQFVVQGYGQKEFTENLLHFLKYSHLTFESQQQTSIQLWEVTGGNLDILRIILRMISESRADTQTSPDLPMSFEEVRETYLDRVNDLYATHVFQHARQLLDREPGCWLDLESLMGGDAIDLGWVENAPSLLELAGVAVRVFDEHGAHLKFASPIMREFVKRTYGHRRFGDLYARANQWAESFEHYKQLNPAERIRPSTSDDRNEVEATVNALCAALYSEATREANTGSMTVSPVDSLKELFVTGCQYILGFRDVLFWYRDTSQRTEWLYDPFNRKDLTNHVVDTVRAILPLDNTLSTGLFPVTEPWSRYAAMAILPTLSSYQQEAVIIGHFKSPPAISNERKRLSDRLLRHFVAAYQHALAVSQTEIRSRVRGRHIAIIEDIFSLFRREELSVQYLLKIAARGLRELGYERVLFCLVDHDRKFLQGILDDCEPPLVSVADKIRYSLSDPFGSLQSFVVNTKEVAIEKDATQSLIADKRVVQAGKMKAFGIAPILNRASEAIGTLLVQRPNDVAPNTPELRELKDFGRQLALAIEHVQRVNLLQSGLDGLPDPILIVDGRPVQNGSDTVSYWLRYTNRPASDLLNIPDVGWKPETGDRLLLTKENAGPIFEIVDASVSKGTRLASHIEGFADSKDYRAAVVANLIKESFPDARVEEATVGSLVRVQDLTYLYKVFEASRHIAEAEDTASALQNMLEAATKLGREQSESVWGRLYLTRETPDGDQEFVSKIGTGFENTSIRDDFFHGRIVLARRSEGHNDWLCVEKREPVVFCWKEGHEDGQLFTTEHGLPLVNWVSPKQPPQIQKHPGDFWMDFPLITTPNNKVLGKICLQCDESLQPENFVYLKVLSETFARLLATYSNFDDQRKTISVAVAERTMSTLAHNVGTRLGGLPGIWADYLDFEAKFPLSKKLNRDFTELNADFKLIIERTFETIKQANALLAPINPKIAVVDLSGEIEKTLKASLPSKAWSLECKEESFNISVDNHLFETALLELVQNSRDHASGAKLLKIKIKLSSIHENGRSIAAISYSDNGPGIPTGLSERIFEDFYSRRPGKKAGTGLGLGFVRRVAEAHGGRAVCNGTRKKGAEFIITLPR